MQPGADCTGREHAGAVAPEGAAASGKGSRAAVAGGAGAPAPGRGPSAGVRANVGDVLRGRHQVRGRSCRCGRRDGLPCRGWARACRCSCVLAHALCVCGRCRMQYVCLRLQFAAGLSYDRRRLALRQAIMHAPPRARRLGRARSPAVLIRGSPRGAPDVCRCAPRHSGLCARRCCGRAWRAATRRRPWPTCACCRRPARLHPRCSRRLPRAAACRSCAPSCRRGDAPPAHVHGEQGGAVRALWKRSATAVACNFRWQQPLAAHASTHPRTGSAGCSAGSSSANRAPFVRAVPRIGI